ncbi:MAG: hypothetical protein O4808_11530, partial [Trichodesmium sp. St17_bin3_1_1]|nr:hypothetical protein [Trichodesmium sp. St17_bin3_1_1]
MNNLKYLLLNSLAMIDKYKLYPKSATPSISNLMNAKPTKSEADPDKTGATLWTFESATGASHGTAVSIGDLVYLQEPEIQSYL